MKELKHICVCVCVCVSHHTAWSVSVGSPSLDQSMSAGRPPGYRLLLLTGMLSESAKGLGREGWLEVC